MSTRVARGVERGPRITIELDGTPLDCFEGETILAAMLAANRLALRIDSDGRERGAFCNMGTCSECFVTLRDEGGARRVRACLTLAAPGSRVSTGKIRHD